MQVEVTDELLEFDPDEYESALAAPQTLPVVEKHEQHVAMTSSTFTDFLLKPELIRALVDRGFEHPSQVQHEALPQAILGNDLICQAQSGMGKTMVFVLSILQQIDIAADTSTESESESDIPHVQAVVICHTRELAFQICGEFTRCCKYFPKHSRRSVKTLVFFGGIPISINRNLLKREKPQIIVGTPGRLRHLIAGGGHGGRSGSDIDVSGVRHLVLDEVDQLLDSPGMRSDVQKIFMSMPRNKQVMMFSATYGPASKVLCRKFMKNPLEIFVSDDSKLTLHGIRQFYVELSESQKNRKLAELLQQLEYNQVFIFVRSQSRARELSDLLNRCGFPSICIHGRVPQEERIRRFKMFRTFQARIVVSTDLMGRGVDVQRVNVVINYDMSRDADIYLHRVGRAGRFGTKGLAISFVTTTSDVSDSAEATSTSTGKIDDGQVLAQVQRRFMHEGKILPLPGHVDLEMYQSV